MASTDWNKFPKYLRPDAPALKLAWAELLQLVDQARETQKVAGALSPSDPSKIQSDLESASARQAEADGLFLLRLILESPSITAKFKKSVQPLADVAAQAQDSGPVVLDRRVALFIAPAFAAAMRNPPTLDTSPETLIADLLAFEQKFIAPWQQMSIHRQRLHEQRSVSRIAGQRPTSTRVKTGTQLLEDVHLQAATFLGAASQATLQAAGATIVGTVGDWPKKLKQFHAPLALVVMSMARSETSLKWQACEPGVEKDELFKRFALDVYKAVGVNVGLYPNPSRPPGSRIRTSASFVSA